MDNLLSQRLQGILYNNIGHSESDIRRVQQLPVVNGTSVTAEQAIRDWSLITGRGEATKLEGGGASPVLSL